MWFIGNHTTSVFYHECFLLGYITNQNTEIQPKYKNTLLAACVIYIFKYQLNILREARNRRS